MSELDLREQIARWLVQYSDRSDYSWGELSSSTHNMFLRRADNLIQSLNLVQLDENRPKIICLCGSTRFTNEMLMLIWEYAKNGVIALGWCILPTNHEADGKEIDHHLAEKEGVADILDELHLRKIDLADEVHIINIGGYIGEGTLREIDYATKLGKPVKYLEASGG